MRSWTEYKKTMEAPENLWQAAKSNSLATITVLVRQGASMNQLDTRGYSPLMLAVYAGNIEAAKLLLQMGADANSSDFSGNSVLMGAAFKGHEELVHLLLEAGADPNAKNSTGMTAIDFANTFGRVFVKDVLQSYQGQIEPMNPVLGFAKILWSRFRKSQGKSQIKPEPEQ